jgi:anti-anti-sigma regulatory factor
VEEFAITVRDHPSSEGGAELGIVGPITHATTPALRDALFRVLHTGAPSCPRLRLNLSCCTSIDVDGLLALAVAQQVARTRSGDLHLVDVPPLIARQLRQHNFDDLLLDPASDQQ